MGPSLRRRAAGENHYFQCLPTEQFGDISGKSFHSGVITKLMLLFVAARLLRDRVRAPQRSPGGAAAQCGHTALQGRRSRQTARATDVVCGHRWAQLDVRSHRHLSCECTASYSAHYLTFFLRTLSGRHKRTARPSDACGARVNSDACWCTA